MVSVVNFSNSHLLKVGSYFNLLQIMLAAFDKPQAVISEDPESDESARKTERAIQLSNHASSHRTNTGKRTSLIECVCLPFFKLLVTNYQYNFNFSTEGGGGISRSSSEAIGEVSNNRKKGMVLPFEPHSITFDDIIYSVDMPQVLRFSKVGLYLTLM